MKFCQIMLHETVELLKNNKLPYSDSILIGENAAGKSEAIKYFLEFPQFYPHSPDFTSIIINNLEKISKI